MAHVILTVSEWERCRPFYEALLSFLGLTRVFAGEDSIYYVGGRTAIGVGRCKPEYEAQRFVQGSVGLHHFCFRARSREDVDQVFAFLREQHAKIVHVPEGGPWAPGYYSVLFEDPVGTRIEVNYVPARGFSRKTPASMPRGITASPTKFAGAAGSREGVGRHERIRRARNSLGGPVLGKLGDPASTLRSRPLLGGAPALTI